MRVYFFDIENEKMIDYLAKRFDALESSYRITHYDGGKSFFKKSDFSLMFIRSEI